MSQNSHETNEFVADGTHGFTFERNLPKLILKRIFYLNHENFRFTRERKGLGKFDDLVYIHENNQASLCQLFQLKHIENTNKLITYDDLAENKKSYFFLPKYFESFLQILETMKDANELNGANLEKLFICTNIDFDDNLGPISKHLEPNPDIFKGSGCLYKLEISEKERKNIFRGSYLTESERLAEELTSFIMKDNDINISAMKKDEVPSLFISYHVSLAQKVFDVKRKIFLQDFLDNPLTSDAGLMQFRADLLSNFNNFCLKYESFTEEELKKVFEKRTDRVRDNIEKYRNTSPENFLRGVKLKLVGKFGDYVSSNELEDFKQDTLDPSDADELIDRFLKLLTFAVNQCDYEYILIREITGDLYNRFSNAVDYWYFKGSYEDPTNKSIRKRNWITKNQIQLTASETIVDFQGRSVLLSEIIKDTSLLDPETLMKLFSGQKLSFQKNEKLKKTTYFYADRILRRKRFYLDLNVLQENKSDIFLISLDLVDQLDTLKNVLPSKDFFKELKNFQVSHRFYILDTEFEVSHWNSFVLDKANDLAHSLNIHWVKNIGNKLLLLRSFGSKFKVKNFVKPGEFKWEEVRDYEDINDGHPILVIGKPGIGKSFLLDHIVKDKLSNQYVSNKGLPLVVRLNLSDHRESLTGFSALKTENDVVMFLSKCENLEDSFSKTVLKHYVTSGQCMFIALDGLDEVREVENQNKVLDMVRYLKGVASKEIWVSARLHLAGKMENILGVDSWSLEEVNRQQQIKIMIEYWKSENLSPSKNEDDLESHANDLIESFTFDAAAGKVSETEKKCMIERMNLASIVLNTPHLEDRENLINYLNEGNIYIEKLKIFESNQRCYEFNINSFAEHFHNSLRNAYRVKPFHFRSQLPSYRSHTECPRTILGIPLQTFMLAFVNPPRDDNAMRDISAHLSLTSLFDSFFEMKFKILIDDKEKLEMGHDHLKDTIRKYHEIHESFAIKHGNLLSQEEIDFLLKFKSFDEEKEDLEDALAVGIVYKPDDTLQMHRSFSEYLIAKRLDVKTLKAQKENCLEDLEKIKTMLLKQDRKNILYFYDHLLCRRNKVHKAILNDDEDFISNISDEDAKTRDCLDRSALYYATKYDKRNTLIPLTFEKFSASGKIRTNETNLFKNGSFYYRHRYFSFDRRANAVLEKFKNIWVGEILQCINFYSLPLIFPFLAEDFGTYGVSMSQQYYWLYDYDEHELPIPLFDAWINFCVQTPLYAHVSTLFARIPKFLESIKSNLKDLEENCKESNDMEHFCKVLNFIITLLMNKDLISNHINCSDSLNSLEQQLKLCQINSERKRAIGNAVKVLKPFRKWTSEYDRLDHMVEKYVIVALKSMVFKDELVTAGLKLRLASFCGDKEFISQTVDTFLDCDYESYSILFAIRLYCYLKFSCDDSNLKKKGCRILGVNEHEL